MEKTIEDETLIGIFPKRLYFGIISNGFIYRLKFAVQNNSLLPLRVRVVCLPVNNDPNPIRLVTFPEKIAPGMSFDLMLELSAEIVRNSAFELRITQDHNKSVFIRHIEANIVTVETFKHVKKSLQLQKRPIYRNNIEVVGPVATIEQMSIHSFATNLSENILMDDDEIEDLLSLPISKNIYWDPFEKCLRIDPLLGKVHVEPNISIEESVSKTAQMRKLRLADLEEQGFLTYKSIDRMRSVQSEKMLTLTADNSFYGDRSKLVSPENELASDDEDDSCEEEGEGDEFTNGDQSGTQVSHTMSVTSLLAMKRDKVEKLRKQSVLLAADFANTSRSDTMVNSQRTLNMITGRPKTLLKQNQIF